MTAAQVRAGWRADGTPLDVPGGWVSNESMRLAGWKREQLFEIKQRNDPTEVRRTAETVGGSESPWYFSPVLAGVAEQVDRRPGGYQASECISMRSLKARGWTPAHVKRLLGAPDVVQQGESLWAVDRAEVAESSDGKLQKRLGKFATDQAAKAAAKQEAEDRAEADFLADASEHLLPRWATKTRAVIKQAGARWQPARKTWLVPSRVLEEAKVVFEKETAARERLLNTYKEISIPREATGIQAMAEKAGALWVPDRRVWLVPPRSVESVETSIRRFHRAANKRLEERASSGPSCRYCGLPATGTVFEFGVPACEECGGE